MFVLEHLNAETRQLILAELDADLAAGSEYLDPRLAEGTRETYLALLRAALAGGTPESFTAALNEAGLLRSHEERRLAGGETITAKVPHNAAATIAEGEFNRYYMRAVCLLAVEAGDTVVEVYRAKPVSKPRPEAEPLRDAREMLAHLRTTNISVEGSFPGPNSGRSLRLPRGD